MKLGCVRWEATLVDDLEQQRIARSRAVAADFEAIFGGMRAAEAAGAVGRVRAARPLEPRPVLPRPSAQLATLGAFSAAALAGLAAGAILMQPDRPGPTRSEAPLRVVTNEPLSMQPEPYFPLSTGLENMPAPVAMTPPPQIQRASAPAPVRAQRPNAAGCGRRCSYAEVMAADRRLRAAYERAARSGVSRAELVAYRRQWDRMRRREADRPQRLVNGYASMASELSRLARDARAARS